MPLPDVAAAAAAVFPTITTDADVCQSPDTITPTTSASSSSSRRSETGVWCSDGTIRRLRRERAVLLERLRTSNQRRELIRLRPALQAELELARSGLEVRRMLLEKLARQENELLDESSTAAAEAEAASIKSWRGWGGWDGRKSGGEWKPGDRLSRLKMDTGEALKTLM